MTRLTFDSLLALARAELRAGRGAPDFAAAVEELHARAPGRLSEAALAELRALAPVLDLADAGLRSRRREDEDLEPFLAAAREQVRAEGRRAPRWPEFLRRRRRPPTPLLLTLALTSCGPIVYDLVGATQGASSGPGPETMSDPSDPSTGPAPSCSDGARNGGETDLDCGGPCPPCGAGQGCEGPQDCSSALCEAGSCAPPECEAAGDCADLGPCRLRACPDGRCVYVDADGLGCDDGDLCTVGDTCAQGLCEPGPPLDCSGLDEACGAGVCQDGACVVTPANEGQDCDDGLVCTLFSECEAGACVDVLAPPPFLREDFDPPGPGWQLGDAWEFGPAQASSCAQLGAEDPATDHTPGGGEGLAGVVIGGCLPPGPLPQDTCLTSPPVPTPGPGPLWLAFWSHLSAPPDPARATVEVWSQMKWTKVFDTGGAALSEGAWTWHTIDLTPHKGPDLRIRFCHHQPGDPTPVVAGWSVDDVVLAPSCKS